MSRCQRASAFLFCRTRFSGILAMLSGGIQGFYPRPPNQRHRLPPVDGGGPREAGVPAHVYAGEREISRASYKP